MQWSKPLTDSQVLGVMSDEGRGLLRGCYFGEFTQHGVLDVDRESKYHSAQELQKLTEYFAAVGITLVPFQSSESGGWHLYYFFDCFVLSEEVETTIKNYLRARKYEIKSGTLEVFPSGNALRLPLQQGFAWLTADGKTKFKREEISKEEALASFLNDRKQNSVNWEIAKNRIEGYLLAIAESAGDAGAGREEIPIDEGFEGLFRGGLDWEKYQRGRDYWLTGLTDKSQRHDAVICIGHYLWYGDKASGLLPLPHPRNAKARAAKIEGWLERNHNGQSKAVNSGQWSEVAGQIERATSWTRQTPLVKEKYEPYPLTDRLLKRLEWLYQKTGKLWTIEELEKANIDRSQDARTRIAVAVAQLELEGSEIDKAKVARRAGACRKTVRKHEDLLGRWGGVYNGGAGDLVWSLQLVRDSSIGGSTDRPTQEFIPLSFSGSESVGAGLFKVAPLFSCLADEPITGAQRKDQALRVPSEVLTPGPTPGDFQALRHVTAGGTDLFDPECYTTATKFSTGAREDVISQTSAGVSFRSQRKYKQTVPDATNYKLLTSIKASLGSQKKDKFCGLLLLYFSRRTCSRAPPGATVIQRW